MKAILPFLCALGVVTVPLAHGDGESSKLKVFAISSGDSDGLRRFERSAKLFLYDYEVITKDAAAAGGAANVFKSHLKSECDGEQESATDRLYMFVKAEETVLVGSPLEITDSFGKLGANIVFAADTRVWPDESWEGSYPLVKENEYQYLYSGSFIGSRKTICEFFEKEVPEVEDDQLFFTKVYLDKSLRTKYAIFLDNRATIFQSMNGAFHDVGVKYLGSHSFVANHLLDTTPKVIVANGADVELNRLGDYVPDGWSSSGGCQWCKEDTISLGGVPAEDLPLVVLAIFIEYPTPFLPSMFKKLLMLHYPFKRIVLTIHNAVPFHAPNVSDFLSMSIIADFHSVEIIVPDKYAAEGDVRNQVLDICVRVNCKYILALDGIAHIDNAETLKELIEQNRPVIAPILRRPNELWSNFWGSVSASGYYSRSPDYMDIVNGIRRGVWNVPCINAAILFRADVIEKVRNAWYSSRYDPDVGFCAYLREKGVFMFVDNKHHYGHLVNADNYNTSHFRPELWELSTNRLDWEELYIDKNYWKIGANKEDGGPAAAKGYETKCNDVYLFPLITPTFARHMIDEMEHNGQWSGGGHYDTRLDGGYENVPTVDIHMNQIDFHSEWLQILKNYISPLAKFSFTGYEPESRANMAFVVRYHPKEQDHLRPHFDSSTWSCVVALTRYGIDFEGGGTNFVRQNCSTADAPLGSVSVFPGRLTHWHEGLRVTRGVRYIIVTFVDP